MHNILKEASDISALSISLVGVVGVFLILLLLSELIRLISKFLPKKQVESSVNPDFAELPYFKERDQSDLAIISALMKVKGHQGKLSIKRVN